MVKKEDELNHLELKSRLLSMSFWTKAVIENNSKKNKSGCHTELSLRSNFVLFFFLVTTLDAKFNYDIFLEIKWIQNSNYIIIVSDKKSKFHQFNCSHKSKWNNHQVSYKFFYFIGNLSQWIRDAFSVTKINSVKRQNVRCKTLW